MKLTAQQRAMLERLAAGKSFNHGVVGRRACAGAGVSLQAMQRTGLIDMDRQLTAAGRAALRRVES
jgi:hypothetical protein